MSESKRLHYFDLDEAPDDDWMLSMAKDQGYVPRGCLLGGLTVMTVVNESKDPCRGCACDRAKCSGRPM